MRQENSYKVYQYSIPVTPCSLCSGGGECKLVEDYPKDPRPDLGCSAEKLSAQKKRSRQMSDNRFREDLHIARHYPGFD